MSASSLTSELSFGKAVECFTPNKVVSRENHDDMVDESIKRDEFGAIDYAFYLKGSRTHRSDAICSLFSVVLRLFK